METVENTYYLAHQIMLIRRLIDLGYDRAFLYASGVDDEIFTSNRRFKAKDELIKESRELKALI